MDLTGLHSDYDCKGQVALIAHFLDLVKLSLESVRMILFIFEQGDQEIAAAVVFLLRCDLHCGVVLLHCPQLKRQVALNHVAHSCANGQL